MTEIEALSIKKKIESLCKEKELWFKVEEDCRPDLKGIVITVSIKVK